MARSLSDDGAAFIVTPVEIVRAVIADLDAAGIPVQEIDGWEDRGRPYAFNPRGAVDHHTATKGYQYDYPSLGIVRDGRSDLPGPLANFGIGRITGTVYVISGGYCNHAGGGGWAGLSGNGSVWGASEAENDGIGEEISPKQTKARLHLHAALCRHTSYGPEMISCHREWSDGGKIDPTGVDGDWLRSAVADLLNNGPTLPEGDIHMLTFRYIFNGLDWVFDGPSGLFFQCDDAVQITEVLDPLGVKALGQVSPATHRRYSAIAKSAKFAG